MTMLKATNRKGIFTVGHGWGDGRESGAEIEGFPCRFDLMKRGYIKEGYSFCQ